jgi:hypothetical protein
MVRAFSRIRDQTAARTISPLEKRRRKEKHAKGRSPFRDSPARVSTEMRVFFRAVRCRGRNAEETRKKRFDPHPARFDRAGFGAASSAAARVIS